MLAELLHTTTAPILPADVASSIEAQRQTRSMDYLFSVDVLANGTATAELVTKSGYQFVLTGLGWWTEDAVTKASIRLEQLDNASGNLSGGAPGNLVGFIPAECFGGFVSYLEEPRDFMRVVGENAYLRASVHNASAANAKIFVLATGYETQV